MRQKAWVDGIALGQSGQVYPLPLFRPCFCPYPGSSRLQTEPAVPPETVGAVLSNVVLKPDGTSKAMMYTHSFLRQYAVIWWEIININWSTGRNKTYETAERRRDGNEMRVEQQYWKNEGLCHWWMHSLMTVDGSCHKKCLQLSVRPRCLANEPGSCMRQAEGGLRRVRIMRADHVAKEPGSLAGHPGCTVARRHFWWRDPSIVMYWCKRRHRLHVTTTWLAAMPCGV